VLPQNKWEHVSERAFDIVMDHLHTLNDTTPKIRCQGRNGVDPELIFGLQSKLFLSDSEAPVEHDEVETLTLGRGGIMEHHHTHDDICAEKEDDKPIQKDTLIEALGALPRDVVWRVKGFVRLEDGKWYILNWAFGRYELKEYAGEDVARVEMTVMGSRGDIRLAVTRFVSALVSR